VTLWGKGLIYNTSFICRHSYKHISFNSPFLKWNAVVWMGLSLDWRPERERERENTPLSVTSTILWSSCPCNSYCVAVLFQVVWRCADMRLNRPLYIEFWIVWEFRVAWRRVLMPVCVCVCVCWSSRRL